MRQISPSSFAASAKLLCVRAADLRAVVVFHVYTTARRDGFTLRNSIYGNFGAKRFPVPIRTSRPAASPRDGPLLLTLSRRRRQYSLPLSLTSLLQFSFPQGSRITRYRTNISNSLFARQCLSLFCPLSLFLSLLRAVVFPRYLPLSMYVHSAPFEGAREQCTSPLGYYRARARFLRENGF